MRYEGFLLRKLVSTKEAPLPFIPCGQPGLSFNCLDWTFKIHARDSGKAFLRTDAFDLSFSGDSLPPEALVEDIRNELQALERALSGILTRSSILNLTSLMVEYPKGYESFLARAIEVGDSLPSPLEFTLEDLFFLTVFEVDQSLRAFHDNKTQHKQQVLSTRVYDGFITEPHVAVAGVHRCGTSWLQSIVETMLSEEKIVSFDAVHDRDYFLSPSELDGAGSFSEIQRLQRYSLPGHRFVGKAPHSIKDAKSWFQKVEDFVDLRVLNIVRDPRNVYLSSRAFFGDTGVPQGELVAGVSFYLDAQLPYREFCRARGGHELSYEALFAQPHEEIRRIAGFFHLPLGEEGVNHVVESTRFEVQTGGRSYGQLKDGDPRRGGSDWRVEFSSAENEAIDGTLGEKLAAFGYSDH